MSAHQHLKKHIFYGKASRAQVTRTTDADGGYTYLVLVLNNKKPLATPFRYGVQVYHGTQATMAWQITEVQTGCNLMKDAPRWFYEAYRDERRVHHATTVSITDNHCAGPSAQEHRVGDLVEP
jgi:hypothetical protein